MTQESMDEREIDGAFVAISQAIASILLRLPPNHMIAVRQDLIELATKAVKEQKDAQGIHFVSGVLRVVADVVTKTSTPSEP